MDYVRKTLDSNCSRRAVAMSHNASPDPLDTSGAPDEGSVRFALEASAPPFVDLLRVVTTVQRTFRSRTIGWRGGRTAVIVACIREEIWVRTRATGREI